MLILKRQLFGTNGNDTVSSACACGTKALSFEARYKFGLYTERVKSTEYNDITLTCVNDNVIKHKFNIASDRISLR